MLDFEAYMPARIVCVPGRLKKLSRTGQLPAGRHGAVTGKAALKRR